MGVQDVMFDFIWPKAVPYLEQAIEKGPSPLSIGDFEELCRDKDMQLWVLWDLAGHDVCGAGVTEILTYPSKRIVRVVLFSGAGVEAWRPWWEDFSEWAKKMGASEVQSFSRIGMKKMLRELGWQHQYDVLVKEL